MMRRLLSTTAVAAGAAALVLATAMPASAHAIVDLTGKPAYAGKSSVMTLEIQHGCGQNGKGINKVVAYFAKPYRKVVAAPVNGWTSTTKRTSIGRKVVWTLRGTAPAFSTPTYFPMTIRWPKKPGTYGLPVKQWCGKATNVWDVPDGPATANQPSPPLYPLPQVRVLPAPTK